MNIAILMRGPFRPSVSSGLARASALAQEVLDHGHSPTVYFASWSQPGSDALKDVLDSPLGQNTIFLETPDDEMMLAHCGGLETLPGGRRTKNTYLQYYLARIGIQVIHDTFKYDYVVHSRPDMDVRMGQFYSEWFSPDHYSTIHHPVTGFQFINDQFAVARPEVMLSAWNYGEPANLGRMIQASFIPEEVLQQMFDASGLIAKVPPLEIWQLDSARNAAS